MHVVALPGAAVPETAFPQYDHGKVTMVMDQRQITATHFKAHLLRLLDEVAETGQSLVITKHGRPVARVEPPPRPEDLRGTGKINMTDEELIYFSMGPWDMEAEDDRP
jgi:prevent-host-death family protein